MIAIIDYGVGNVGSVQNMVEHVGGESVITNDVKKVAECDKYILPGVGSFDSAIHGLNDSGLIPILTDEVINKQKYILGICLGMQIMTKKSSEGGIVP